MVVNNKISADEKGDKNAAYLETIRLSLNNLDVSSSKVGESIEDIMFVFDQLGEAGSILAEKDPASGTLHLNNSAFNLLIFGKAFYEIFSEHSEKMELIRHKIHHNIGLGSLTLDQARSRLKELNEKMKQKLDSRLGE